MVGDQESVYAVDRSPTEPRPLLRHICRVKELKRDTVVLYACFIGDTADHVLNQLIESTISRDRDYLAKSSHGRFSRAQHHSSTWSSAAQSG